MAKSGIQENDAIFEPYYCLAQDGAEPTWHPFSQLPPTQPKVSSIRVRVDPLDEWAWYWDEKHSDHDDCPTSIYDPSNFRLPHLSDAQNDKTEKEEVLLACCGTVSPHDKGTDVVVKATGDFVTIHDYLSIVQPYLMQTAKGLVVTDEEEWEGCHRKRTPVPPRPGTSAAWYQQQRQQQGTSRT